MKGIGKLLMLLGLLTVVIGLFGAPFLLNTANVDSIILSLSGLKNILNLDGLRMGLLGLPPLLLENRVKLLAGGGIGFLVGWILSR